MAFSVGELVNLYINFEAKRIEKAKALVGNRVMRPDHFCSFIVNRTTFCPHKLAEPVTNYWLETINLLDSEYGLTLPATLDQVPALFFEALSIVRTSRNTATREDK